MEMKEILLENKLNAIQVVLKEREKQLEAKSRENALLKEENDQLKRFIYYTYIKIYNKKVNFKIIKIKILKV